MTSGEGLFGSILAIIGRHHRVSDVDLEAGVWELHGEDRTVRVVLDLNLLAEYSRRLDEHDIPDLPRTPQESQDGLRAKRIAMWIEELFESDLDLTLVEIRLDRAADGRISLVDRRGSARRSSPLSNTDSGYWTSDGPRA